MALPAKHPANIHMELAREKGHPGRRRRVSVMANAHFSRAVASTT